MWSVKLFSLLTIFGLAAVELSTASRSQHATTSLVEFMIQSQPLTQKNPQRSVNCFGLYTPILSKLTEAYETEYAECEAAAEKQRTDIDNGTLPQRQKLEGLATSACNAVRSCSENKSAQSYFECFIKEGSVNTKSMYEISANASEILLTVQEDYRLITNSKFKCTNSSERAYVQNTAATFEELHNCLLGIAPVTASPPIPEQPVTQPEQPVTQPEQPVTEPEQPVTEPEQPVTQPEQPVTEPEQPVTQPEQPQTKPEEPQPEQPQPEQPQPDEPQPEQPQAEQAQPEEPQPEQPQPEQPQPEEPQPEQPQPEQPQPEQPQPEEPQPEQPQPEQPVNQRTEEDSSLGKDESDENSSKNDSSNDSESGAIKSRTLTEDDFLKSIFKNY